MIRAAIYARFSSDLQRDKSIDDQIALCREVAAREGMTTVACFEDRAVSGSSAINRPGFQTMLRGAESRQFDCIIAEDIDRISRDQADYHTARKRLDFLGISIHTATGKVTRIDGALRALMGEMFLENLALHTRRGLEGVIRDGRHAGGRAYGYRPVPGQPGVLVIVEAEAAIIRRIFSLYVKGQTPRDIAAGLNRDGVKPPRGLRWNASTINGNLARGDGLLQNEIYIGQIVWNKVRMIKDPATGKRLSRPNTPDQHRRADAPQLRIIDDETWKAARARKLARTKSIKMPPRTARLLSGLLKCANCGGGMVSNGMRFGTARIQCGTYVESGACTNSRRVKRDDVEAAVLNSLKAELTSPVVVAEYLKAYNAERQRLAKSRSSDLASLERRQAQIAREMERLIDMVADGSVAGPIVAPKINALELERTTVASQLSALSGCDNVVRFHPAAIDRYQAAIDQLQTLSANDASGSRDALFDSVRTLVHSVIVDAAPNSQGFKIEIRGRLNELLKSRQCPTLPSGGRKVVAREGL